MDEARLTLREHITHAGGVSAVARELGVARSTLYRFLAGGDLEAPRRAALRALLPRVPLKVWADLYAPKEPKK